MTGRAMPQSAIMKKAFSSSFHETRTYSSEEKEQMTFANSVGGPTQVIHPDPKD
jgi:tRNA G37 N-methylase TrmD